MPNYSAAKLGLLASSDVDPTSSVNCSISNSPWMASYTILDLERAK
uniref:Uncharacterized protein n=1 Tax=Brassica oleracea TaxID=3712 RepID=A0A3P6EH45_BRAOL|nr:unnamed protein product [Brassica oleracea]